MNSVFLSLSAVKVLLEHPVQFNLHKFVETPVMFPHPAFVRHANFLKHPA